MTIFKVPLISVCIPVFQGENFISKSVESVLNQTEKNFELLVVDNCSTDQTINIVKKYDDPRIKVFVNERNLSADANFNRCIELAKGEFIILLPHDDALFPTALEVFSKALVSDPEVGLAYSSHWTINHESKKLQFFSKGAEDKVMSGNEAFTRLAEGCPIQCAMIRREIYLCLGLWDTDIIISDWDMWCRIALAGYKFAYFKDPQNYYRLHSKNGSNAYIRNNNYYSGIFKGMKKIYNTIPAQSDFQKLRPKSAKWILRPVARHLVFSLISGNWTHVKQDMSLLAKIVRWAGVFRTIPFF